MVKNSFTLLESLISLVILTIVISILLHSIKDIDNSDELFVKLNKIENIFNSKEYKNLSKNIKNINIVINKRENKTLNLNSYEYFDGKIRVYRYEM